jgi:hypothetical protein
LTFSARLRGIHVGEIIFIIFIGDVFHIFVFYFTRLLKNAYGLSESHKFWFLVSYTSMGFCKQEIITGVLNRL